MSAVKMQFGGGALAPKLIAHVSASETVRETPTPTSEFGGGVLAPKIEQHARGSKGETRRTATVEFGGGFLAPRLAAHLRAASPK